MLNYSNLSSSLDQHYLLKNEQTYIHIYMVHTRTTGK